MASSLHRSPSFVKPHPSLIIIPRSSSGGAQSSYVPVRCGGPQSWRLPLVKGRILSIEAIQALKRLHRTNPTNLRQLVSNTLSRLIKSDLLATLKELLRQDQCALALQVFSTFRSEYNADLSLYGEMVQALDRNGLAEDVDRLILDLELQGGIQCEDKGLISLIKAVIGARRVESTVRIYQLMKRSGWASSVEPDEYVVKALVNGFKSFGDEGLAEQLQNEYNKAFAKFSRDKLETFTT